MDARTLRWTLAGVLCVAAVPALAFDRVLLKDGRAIDGKLLASEDAAFLVLRLPGADVPIPVTMIDKTFVEDLEDYVPKSKAEERYLAEGKVLFEGTWVSRTRREQELAKRRDADEAAIKKAREEQKWQNRKQLKTRHFDITSNCTQEVLDEYAGLMEAYYDYFTDFWSIKLSAEDAKRRMKFFLYRNAADFYSVTGMPRGVLGFFNFVEGELHLYDMYDDRPYAQDVMFHEGNHLLTHLIDTGFLYPPWMNEGMAEYYGTAVVDEKGRFTVGGLQYGRIAAMRNDEATGRTLSIREVMMAEPGGSYTGRHYGYGWSFVHFLMQTPEYAKKFQAFFKSLPENLDVKHRNVTFQTTAFMAADEGSVIEAFEKRMGKSVEDLEAEWKAFTAQAYGELTPSAYYYAARIFRSSKPMENDEHVTLAMGFYQKAVDGGIRVAACYREYAEMLRKGGADEGIRGMAIVAPPNPEQAWAMCQKAIQIDPIDALNYTEGAGALIMDSAVQDLDRAYALVQTAKALAPRNPGVSSLVDELMALIEPARERAAERKALEERLAATDLRRWIVQPFYIEGQTAPERTPEMSTDELRQLIRAGKVTAKDWIFQAYRWPDETSGELKAGTEPWDNGWVLVKDVPVFADDLAAAPAEGPAKP